MRCPSSVARVFAVLAICCVSSAFAQVPLGSAISYTRSEMKLDGQLLDGEFDVRFRLFDAATGGNQVGPVVSANNITINDGVLPVQTVDFGSGSFNGQERWIETRAREGINVFRSVGPRQPVQAVPYALALPGFYTVMVDPEKGPNVIGGFRTNEVAEGIYGATIAGGGSLNGPNTVTGNYGTIGGGFNNNVGSEATIGGGNFHIASGTASTIGGGAGNDATGASSTVSGGSNNIASNSYATIAGGSQNVASNLWSTVSGGVSNQATGPSSIVGGGAVNRASGVRSTVAGGGENTAIANYATVAGGSNCHAEAEGATVGGGQANVALGYYSTVAGGRGNDAAGSYSTVSGGQNNHAEGFNAIVCGGEQNFASGGTSIVLGGYQNVADGDYTLAAGRRANADHQGSFVWGDSTNADVSSSAANQFTARAIGGVRFFTNSALTAGVKVAAGGGSWSSVSDREAKENFKPVDTSEVLARLCAMPMMTWNYKSQSTDTRHIGPMAQDFKGAFGVGEDDKHIATIDADGVALAAIQGLHQIIRDKDHELESLKSQLNDMSERLRRLEALVVGSGGQ